MNTLWYIRRLRRMSAREVVSRGAVAARQWWWSDPARRPDLLATLLQGARRAHVALPRDARVQGPLADAVIRAAERLLHGQWQVFHLTIEPNGTCPPPLEGRVRGGVHPAPSVEPLTTFSPAPPTWGGGKLDWFHDPLTGRRAPHDTYCFRIPHRDEASVGNIKFVWELSRHQPLTLLACAWWLTGDDRFAECAARHLRSWWAENPFLQGVHWVSGIEVGLRLLSWTWIRALLADWPGAAALFEDDEAFVQQLYAHSRYLSVFPQHRGHPPTTT